MYYLLFIRVTVQSFGVGGQHKKYNNMKVQMQVILWILMFLIHYLTTKTGLFVFLFYIIYVLLG